MMRRNLYILAIASLLSGNYVFAQDAVKQWSLEEKKAEPIFMSCAKTPL